MTSRSFLRTPSEAAGPGDEATIQDLVDTLEANRSRCVGMAANMIGVSKRIIVFVDEDLGGRITVMLNPVITASDGAFDVSRSTTRTVGSAPATPPSPAGPRRSSNTKSITATASSSDSFGARCSPPPPRGWSSRLRCNYIATAMTSFFMCTGGVGVLSGVGVPCAGRLASLRGVGGVMLPAVGWLASLEGVGGVMLPAVGWLASLEVLSASVMCQRVAGWLR